jgi:hypothetical protein
MLAKSAATASHRASLTRGAIIAGRHIQWTVVATEEKSG